MTFPRRTVLAGFAGALVAPRTAGRKRTGGLAEAIAGLPDSEASAAVAQLRGDVRWAGSSGVTSVRESRRPALDSRFRIGSMTKTFTAVVVLQLAAEGRIDLGAPVQRYLPGLLPASYRPIPVRSLLTWTSGLNGVDVDSKDPAWFFANRFRHFNPGDQLDLTVPLAFEPGTAQRYGNADYIVAGLLVQRIAQARWESEVHRRILRPLGLTATSTPRDDPAVPGPHVHGYEATASGWVDVTLANPSLQWSAAAMISTVADLDTFLVALFRGRLLPPPYLEEMFTVPDVPLFGTGQAATYSAGLSRTVLDGRTVWVKSGERPGYVGAMAAPRDLSRRLVYSVNTLHMGSDQPPAVAQRLVQAALSA